MGRIVLFLLSLTMLSLSVISTLNYEKPISIEMVDSSADTEDQFFNILVLGSDSVIPRHLMDYNGRSDLILTVCINKITGQISIISIPRDSYLKVPAKLLSLYGQNIQTAQQGMRINAANAIAGPDLARVLVQKLLGTKVDRIVVLSIAGFKALINKLGKLEIFVPKHLVYHDHKANLHIDIPAGRRYMDGEALIKFLRYRDRDQGDIGRIKRQQIFIRALVNKLQEPETLKLIPELIEVSGQLFLTDMKVSEMLGLASILGHTKRTNFNGYIVPGDFGTDGSWRVKHRALRAIMTEILGVDPYLSKENRKRERQEKGRAPLVKDEYQQSH